MLLYDFGIRTDEQANTEIDFKQVGLISQNFSTPSHLYPSGSVSESGLPSRDNSIKCWAKSRQRILEKLLVVVIT